MPELWNVYLGDLQTPVLAILLMDATKYLPGNHLRKRFFWLTVMGEINILLLQGKHLGQEASWSHGIHSWESECVQKKVTGCKAQGQALVTNFLQQGSTF